MTTIVEVALYYAGRGWQVFPLAPRSKKPAIADAHPVGDPLHGKCLGNCGRDGHGLNDATTDVEKIKEWWRTIPDANIGIATGARSGIVVLDVDSGHGGDESLMALIAEYGQLPETPLSLTGGGGRHYVFAHPGFDIRNSAGKIAPGIDLRGDGGYIAAPTSTHPNGKLYEWEINSRPSQTPLAAMPQWLVELAMAGSRVPIQPEQGDSTGSYISGQRNNALTSLAGSMRRRGMSEESIRAAIQAENQSKCVPPLSDDEINRIAGSVCRYAPKDEPKQANKGQKQQVEIEHLLASSIYKRPEALKEVEWLKSFMFLDESVRKFWELMLGCGNVTQAASESGMMAFLEKNKDVDPSRLLEYANQIARYGYLAKVSAAWSDIQRFSESGDVGKVQQIVNTLAQEIPPTGSKPKVATEGLLEVLALLTDDDPDNIIKTRIGNFDSEVGGLERQAFSILAGRTSMGKSTLAWQIARNAAADRRRVLFFSLEMSSRSLWAKAACGIAEVRYKDLMSHTLPEEKFTRMQDEIIPTLMEVYGNNLMIVDDVSTTDAIWQITMQNAPDLVVVDYLGLITDPGDNEVVRLGRISSRLKALSKSANCHVMAPAQIGRGVEGRENKRPQLSDLRDSGHLEQNGDLVMMIYRPDYYEDKKRERYCETELLIRKNRMDDAGFSLALYYDTLQQWFYRESELSISRIDLERMTK